MAAPWWFISLELFTSFTRKLVKPVVPSGAWIQTRSNNNWWHWRVSGWGTRWNWQESRKCNLMWKKTNRMVVYPEHTISFAQKKLLISHGELSEQSLASSVWEPFFRRTSWTYSIIRHLCASILGAAAISSMTFLLLHSLSAVAEARGLEHRWNHIFHFKVKASFKPKIEIGLSGHKDDQTADNPLKVIPFSSESAIFSSQGKRTGSWGLKRSLTKVVARYSHHLHTQSRGRLLHQSTRTRSPSERLPTAMLKKSPSGFVYTFFLWAL